MTKAKRGRGRPPKSKAVETPADNSPQLKIESESNLTEKLSDIAGLPNQPDAPTPDAPTPDAPTPDAPTPDAPTEKPKRKYRKKGEEDNVIDGITPMVKVAVPLIAQHNNFPTEHFALSESEEKYLSEVAPETSFAERSWENYALRLAVILVGKYFTMPQAEAARVTIPTDNNANPYDEPGRTITTKEE